MGIFYDGDSMSELTITEVIEKKRILTKKVLTLLEEFQGETGVKITGIHLRTTDEYRFPSSTRRGSFITEIAIDTAVAD